MPYQKEDEGIGVDAFAIPELWRVTLNSFDTVDVSNTLFKRVDLNLPSINQDNPYTTQLNVESIYSLPLRGRFEHDPFRLLIDDFSDHAASSQADFELSTSESSLELLSEPTDVIDDIWGDPDSLPTLKNQTELISWSSFLKPLWQDEDSVTSTKSGFLSEAGASVFDAALLLFGRTNERFTAGRVVHSDAILTSLFQLGLGRTSILFPFDEDAGTFRQAIIDAKMSGTSRSVCEGVINEMMDLATVIMALKAFITQVYDDLEACAGLVALASSARVIMDTFEQQIIKYQKSVASLLQLQEAFDWPGQVLRELAEVIEVVATARTDVGLCSSMFEVITVFEDCGRDTVLLQTLFSRISQPWLESLDQSIGLQQQFGVHRLKQAIELPKPTDSVTSQVISTGSRFPDFISPEQARLIEETEECIGFMKKTNPSHPLTNSEQLNKDGIHLEVGFGWGDLDRIARVAQEYYDSIQAVLSGVQQPRHVQSISTPPKIQIWDEQKDLMNPWKTPDVLSDDPLPPQPTNEPSFHALITKYMESSDMLEHAGKAIQPTTIDSLQDSLLPLLTMQHSLLSAATLRTIFNHSIRHSFDTLHAFHMFSSGTFTTRLSQVLFAPDVEAAERRKGIIRTGRSGLMGLRLGSGKRSEWPPTSSELSLALLGVLEASGVSLSAHSNKHGFLMTQNDDADHIQGLSFALRRNLAAEEIDRILDADSLYALDFLKLSYTPPPALGIVFDDHVLEKYDRIFKLLLRLLRVQFVLGQLFKDSIIAAHPTGATQHATSTSTNLEDILINRFRTEATQFINTIIAHFLQAGVAGPWNAFNDYLSLLESILNPLTKHPKYPTPNTQQATLGSFRTIHLKTLKTIHSTLFLRYRQRKLAGLLEDIGTHVLVFTKTVHLRISGLEQPGTALSLRETYATFRSNVDAFTLALEDGAERAEMGRHGRGAGVVGEDEKGVGEALAGLAMLLRR